MRERETIGEGLARRGISRRALLRYSAWLASLLALPPLPRAPWPRCWPTRPASR